MQRTAAAAIGLQPAASLAAQRGAEDPYATQYFDQSSVCSERTLLGACKQVEKAAKPAGALNPSAVSTPSSAAMVETEESELVKRLLAKTAQNAEQNARLVKEKTVAAGISGTYGPFASTAPVMRVDGSFDAIPLARFDRLKDKGKIVRTTTGLDAYVSNFDPDAPEPKSKLFGLF